jgi:hypothetical protein
MAVEMKYEPNGICALRIRGILKRSEFDTEQSALAHKIDTGSKPRLLVILENFEGWERNADWGNDLDFFFLHSGKISRSPSSLSHVGRQLRSLLPERESVARR